MNKRRKRTARKSVQTNAQKNAQKRNFAKYRLCGMQTQLTNIINNVPLSDRERERLHSAHNIMSAVINYWEHFKTKLER